MRWHLTPVVMVLKYRVTLSFVSRLSIEPLSLERVSNYLGSQVNTMFELNQCGPCYERAKEYLDTIDIMEMERGAEVESIKMQWLRVGGVLETDVLNSGFQPARGHFLC